MTEVKDNSKRQVADMTDTSKAGSRDVSGQARSTGKKPDGSRAEAVLEAVKGAAQDVVAGASNLASQGRDMAQKWAGSAADTAGQAKDSAQKWAGEAIDAIGRAEGKAMELASTAADRVGDFGQDMTRLIRRYPLQAVLLGFGVGFLLARVTHRSGSLS